MHSLISGRLQREPCLNAQFNTWGFIWGFIPAGKKETDFPGLKRSTKGTLVIPREQTGHCKQGPAIQNTDVGLCSPTAASALHCKSCTERGDHTAGSRASPWNPEKWAKQRGWKKETGEGLIQNDQQLNSCAAQMASREMGELHTSAGALVWSLLQPLPSMIQQQHSNPGYREPTE